MENLSRLNSSLSNKEKLIQINENSSNPLYEKNKDYNYEKFKKEYDKKQQIINNNINKFFPQNKTKKNKLIEIPLTFEKTETLTKSIQSKLSKTSINKDDYIKILEDQIKYKKEQKKKEEEEIKRMEQKYNEEIKKQIKKEEEEKIKKEKDIKEEFIKGNMDIINKKKEKKVKELEQKLKYKDEIDKKNEIYKKELLEKQKENEKLLDEINNSNNKKIIIKEIEKEKIIDEKNKKDDKYKNTNNNYHHNNMGECCRCHRVLPRKLLTINKYNILY